MLPAPPTVEWSRLSPASIEIARQIGIRRLRAVRRKNSVATVARIQSAAEFAVEAREAAGIRLRVPRPGLCTDNGAMIAAAAHFVAQRGHAGLKTVLSPEAKYTFASVTFTKADLRVKLMLSDTGRAPDGLNALAMMVVTMPAIVVIIPVAADPEMLADFLMKLERVGRRGQGHSSAEQAGEIATKAEVGKLYLIHYPTGRFANGDIAAEARRTFQGEVLVAKDFMTIDI